MKTKTCDQWQVPGAKKSYWDRGDHSGHGSRVTGHVSAFTLIELLVVIAIIAVIAAFLFPLAGVVKQRAFIHNAQAQMAQLETAIENYKSVYGFYPPGSSYGPVTNQLFYELEGTLLTNDNGTVSYMTLDHGVIISTNNVPKAFGTGVGGFMNCNKPGADESAPQAQNFLPGLNTNQVATVTVGGVSAEVLVTPLGGPEPGYNPMPGNADVNPWRYRSPGINNPNSYDLWIQLAMPGKTNLICNWSKQVQINNSVP